MNLTQRKALLASFQPIVDSLNDSFKTQKSVIEDQIKSIDKLIASNKKMAKSATTLVESHAKTEKAARLSIETQKKLGVVLDKETGKLFNKAGLRVDEFGRAVTKTDEKMGDFNKRSQIMNSTIAFFTKQGRAVSFLEGYTKYLEMGGSRLEYFAEFLSSAREELTVFGLEAAKARKVMYGFLPPGMFRLVNKFSSSFQFLGGTLRKLKDNGKEAKKQLDDMKAVLATLPPDGDDFKELTAVIEELEKKRPPPNIINTLLKGVSKIGKSAQGLGKKLDEAFGGVKPDTSKDAEKLLNVYGEKTLKAKLGITQVTTASGNWLKVQKNIYKGLASKGFLGGKIIAKGLKDTSKGILKYMRNPIKSAKSDWAKSMKFIKKNSLYKTFVEEKGDLKRQFKEGFDVAEAMADNQKLIDKFDMGAIEKELATVNKALEDTEVIESNIAALKSAMVAPDTAEDIIKNENLLKQIEYYETLGERQQELQNAAEKHMQLTKKQQVLEAKNIGSIALKQQIDDALEVIRVTEDRLKLIPDEIAQKEENLRVLKEEKKELEKAKKAASGKKKAAIDRQIKAKKKEISTTKVDITGLKTEQANAPVKIEENKKTVDNNKEQLKLLREAKKESFAKLLNKHPTLLKITNVFKSVGKILPMLGNVLRFAAMSMVYVMLAILGIVILIKAFGPIIKEAFTKAMDFIQPLIGFVATAWEGVKEAFGTIMNGIFGDGGIEGIIDGFIDLGISLVHLAGTLLLAGLGLLAAFTWELLKGLWKAGIKWVKGIFKDARKMAKTILVIIAIVAGIAAMVLGAPLWIAVAIGAVLYKVLKMVGLDRLTKIIQGIMNVIKAIKKAIAKISPFAEGGQVKNNGLQLVGEKGPELVSLPKGSQVFSNRDSVKMANASPRGGNATTNNINITINAKDTSRAEMDRIAKEVSRTITNSIQRQSNTSNLR